MAEAPRSAETVVREAAETVYAALGEGHSEATYHAAMTVELQERGVRYWSKPDIVVTYRDVPVGRLEPDLVIVLEDGLVVELKKAQRGLEPANKAQLRAYLRTMGHECGLLVNFAGSAPKVLTVPVEPDADESAQT